MAVLVPLFVLAHSVFQRQHSNHFLRVLQREVAYAVLCDEASLVLCVPDDSCELALWVSANEKADGSCRLVSAVSSMVFRVSWSISCGWVGVVDGCDVFMLAGFKIEILYSWPWNPGPYVFF